MNRSASHPATPILASIATARAEAARLEASYSTLFERFGREPADSLAGKSLVKVESDHKEKLAQIKKLESALAGAKSSRPTPEIFDQLRSLIGTLDGMDDEERIATRGRIANTLPSIVKSVSFGWDHVAIPEDKRKRADASGYRKVKAKVVPVSRWSVEFVDSLPATLPMTSAGHMVRLVHQWQHDETAVAAAFKREGDRIVFHPENIKIPI